MHLSHDFCRSDQRYTVVLASRMRERTQQGYSHLVQTQAVRSVCQFSAWKGLKGLKRLSALPPVARSSFQVSNRDDDSLIFHKTVYDLIRKPMHQHTARSVVGRRRAYFGLRLNDGDSVNYGIKEFTAQSRTLRFVPTDRGGKLFARGLKISEYSSHRRRISCAIRSLTLSHDSSSSVPASSALTRRSISSSQAAAASGSAGPSRLASSSDASSARAWASSRRASASMDSLDFVIVSILPSSPTA